MKRFVTLLTLALALLTLTGCLRHKVEQKVPEESVQTLCEYMVSTYPQATLQDLYKTCYQDFFGPGHMVIDSASARGYLLCEVEQIKANGMNGVMGEWAKDEPTGFRHRFARVDLRRIALGEIGEDELLRRFMDAANTATPVHDNWADEWTQIEAIALQVHTAWADVKLQADLHNAAANNQAVHHSEAFRKAYRPHYRLVKL